MFPRDSLTSVRHRSTSGWASMLLLIAVTGCATDQPTGIHHVATVAAFTKSNSGDGKVDVCHQPYGPNPHITNVSINALGAHLAHGDYIAGYDVDKLNTTGDGIHFNTISDALDSARASRHSFHEQAVAACRITITIGPGTFTGTYGAPAEAGTERFPLLVDVPDVTLQGGLRLVPDANGRATAGSESEAAATTLSPDHPLTGTEVMVIVKDATDGYVGNGAIINGIAFLSGHTVPSTINGGFGIFAIRVVGLAIENNRFATSLASAIDTRASSATIQRNYVAGMGTACGFCLAGPGVYTVADNSIYNGGRVGVLLIPATTVAVPAGVAQYVPQSTAAIAATLTNNSVTDHTRHMGGTLMGTPPVPAAGYATGVRVVASGIPASTQSSNIVLANNSLLRNSYGLMIDGGGQAVTGNITVSLNDNDITQNCRMDLLVSFAAPNRALGVNNMSPYLTNSTYAISLGGDVPASRRWIDNPAGYGNSLVIDGQPVGNTTPLATVPASAPCTP